MSGQTFTTLLYGAIVNQILDDVQDPTKTTQILNNFGVSIGSKLVDDYISRQPTDTKCQTFQQAASGVTAAIAYFLAIDQSKVLLNKDNLKEDYFEVKILENPLEQFVKVPQQLQGLNYMEILPGAVIGAMKQLAYDVDAKYESFPPTEKEPQKGLLTVKKISQIETRFAQQQ